MWTLVAAYIVCVVLLHVPTVQHFVGLQVAEALSQKFGTEVTVGRVDLGLFNRIIIDDVLIKDQQHKDMLASHRLSAKISIIDLINGKISISSAQIFSLTANIIKPSATEPLNCQFIIDSLQSKDTTKHTPLDLHIGSLVIRNTNVSYNRLDMPLRHNIFDINHLELKRLSTHILLNTLTDDSLSVIVKKLSVDEQNSGLSIQRLAFDIIANHSHISIPNLSLTTSNSELAISASANIYDKKIINYRASISDSKISTKDVALFVPQLSKLNRVVSLNTTLSGTPTSFNIANINATTDDKALIVKGKGSISSFHNLTWNANIPVLHVEGALINDVITAFKQQANSNVISQLGSVDAKITASGSGNNYKGQADIKTGLGNVNANGSFMNKHLTANVKADNLKLGTLLNTTNLSNLDASLNIQTDIIGGSNILVNTKADLQTPLLTIGSNTFRNLDVNIEQQGKGAKATLMIADLNVNADINIETTNLPALISAITKKSNNAAPVSLKADIAHINPNALGLTDKWPSRSFSALLSAEVNDILHPLNNFAANISNFSMTDPNGSYYLDHLSASSLHHADGTKTVTLDSDFANAHIDGKFDISTLSQSITNLIASRLPTLPGISSQAATSSKQNNDVTIDATINNTDILRKLFGTDITLSQPVTLNGYINSRNGQSDINLNAPSITYGTTTYLDTKVHIYSPDEALHIIANTSRDDSDGRQFKMQLEGQAIDNQLNTVISWDNGEGFLGNLHASNSFMKNAMGKTQTTVNILPSEIMIGDTTWYVRPSTATYYANHLDIDNFCIEHGKQHIRINGTATPSANDSLIVNLRDVNVGYILDLVNFHSVEFDGLASGTATAHSVFSTPDASADLTVNNFLFEQGRMGTLHAKAHWDNQLGQIDIDGLCDDDPGQTKIDGYVSIKRNYIDLAIKANRTRLEFLKSFCSSFLDDVNAEASGQARVFGDLKTVNLSGKVVANGNIHVSSLNTSYTLRNDTVTMIPDDIIFHRDSVFDGRGGYGLLSGGLHHKHLSRITFDFDIDAHHLLCYDFNDLDGSTFCGHCVGTGKCKIKGRPGEIDFDIDAYPEATSEIVYNVSSPDALQNQEFITWRTSPTLSINEEKQTDGFSSVTTAGSGTKPADKNEEDDNFRTNMHLNFLIHCTPAATLRLIMDQRTGDYITLNGNGTLRASWYNKGGMQIFGNYNVEHGTYKMTMQQVITKNFEFQPGGSIVFAGDPFESVLSLQALYVVPSVSLSDLNLGSSLSTGTTRVNCLMNITGTAEHPVVDFDLALPQASTDIQQMITALMDSEEERTQQVIYLLSIGRFYNADNGDAESSATQTSLAMQSFLSGTLSQQINNVISSQLLKSNNWNFGANISPGDEGMNNAEYEGLINGRLFNDRLLINGQFGYRDNVNTANTSFIGDFDVRYLITPNGNIQVRVYNQATDRYFIKNNLNTQGIGIILKHDFDNLLPKFLRKKK